MNRKYIAAASILLVGLYNCASWATTATTSFSVSANVLNACIVVATSMAFIAYNPSTGSTATNAIGVTCTLNDSYTIALNAGTTSGATTANRMMTNGSNTLNYAIYTNTNNTTIWGDGSLNTSTVPSSGLGVLQTFTAYGYIPAGQNVPAGVYADTVTVTVTY